MYPSKHKLFSLIVLFFIISNTGFSQEISLVKDINISPSDSNPSNFVIYNDLIFFQGHDDEHGAELWVSNGHKRRY